MKCPNHLLTNVAGYCAVCGMFACESCLTVHEGNKYCARHYKPIADKLKAQAQSTEIRKKHGRQHLIIHFSNGENAYGIARNLNTREVGFFLEVEDPEAGLTGETLRVHFDQVKYIANVKSYSGKVDPTQEHPQYNPTGSPIVIRFQDGEILEGTTMHNYVPTEPRFYLIPHDPMSNNINVLVEKTSIDRVFTPEGYEDERRLEKERKKELKAQKKDSQLNRRASDGDSDLQEAGATEPALSQEESMGDFYFETHNYPNALEQYVAAYQKAPHSVRLSKKVSVSNYNIGVQFIKSREFPKALEYMEQSLAMDPNNPHAKKKAKQLRKTIEKTERRMREYYEEQERKQTEA